ncbi:KN motif and ankyrin repeat domain-containing protein 3 [Melanotaenia boesemani]|uniref:KN motif and ankyrin repeat domain-containing protein 3 n=1 Tax=Melanotaenia boesemani TaxID=1250792 RepID=UPI001C05055C|nr:KN motif and ankyrin repeat domain-containing protein 3 [Melanotaenia boesemani]XP_041863124.1 KN motif and ankyrin repeat domain-containing protein 3 [Melanotaenia boesemani]XP_041863125.1 KN motif and ankyrin repeat domain-containing protein 3 [Melanotaenia boesemani]
MTQSVQVNSKLPDLGSPFLYSSQEEADQPGSYSVQTPYGFQLDLDFLKYVEEIESGHNLRRAPVSSRRPGRGLKLSQRSTSVGGRTSGWTSTESLASPASEDGRAPPPPPPRNRLGSAPCEGLSLSPITFLNASPLSTGAKVPPPPPQRNPRVERTLLETSRRLQQEQTHQHQNGGRLQLADPPKQLTPSPSLKTVQSSWTKPSPQTSGRSTPAAGITVTPIPPSQLQTVREQMATALKQLKEMEERVKGVPALEKEVAQLRAEKDMLVLALEEKKAAMEVAQKKQQSTESSTQTAETLQPEHSHLASPNTTGHKGLGKSGELKRLTEKFEGKEQKVPQPSSKVNTSEKVVVQKKSVAVGDDVPMASVVFYYSHGVKDSCVGTEVKVCEKLTGTESPLVHEQAVQVSVETEEAEVWVMESLLGLTTEAQREIDTLQDTIKFQQESITVLEDRLNEADKDLGILRSQMEEKTSKLTFEKDVLAKPDMKDAQVETLTSVLKHAAVLCRPEVTDACISWEADQTEQGTQTEAAETAPEPAPVELVSTGCQYENLGNEKTEEQKVTVPKKRQLTIAEYKVSPDEELVGGTEKKDEGEGEETVVSSTQTTTGMLKSIMKRKDGSNSSENRTAGKKSLQFVGILNGGYESTSSEEEEEEEEEEEDGSSSGESGEGECLDSTEEDEAALEEETSEEERNVNLDESDTDEETLRAANYSSDAVKEKFEFSSKMREACLILKNHLNEDVQTLKSKEVLSSTHTVQLEWFRISSAKMAQPPRVSDYLMAFSEVSSVLLQHVVNMTDGNGNTALHYSVSHSNFGVVSLLLDTGVCCVDKQNKAGYTAIMLAALSTVKEEEDMAVVKKLFSQGNVNAKASQAGQTALMLAVSHGRQEMVRALLECGADVNVQDDEGSTALMCASEHGRAEIVKLLLEQPGCDISIVDNDGSNALSIALEAAHNDTAVLLYAHMNYAKTQTAMGSPKAQQRSPTSPHKSWPAD